MEVGEIHSITRTFDKYTIQFMLDDKLYVICYYDCTELFCIHDGKLSISNFRYTRDFFGLFNEYSEISKAAIESYNSVPTYSLKILNEMTSHTFTHKLNEIAEAYKLQERTDISGRKIYKAFKNDFPDQINDDDSIRLVFVD
jgi:hypothetical protein